MTLTAIPRITLGLVSLSVCLLLGFDLLLKVFPSEADTTREVRLRVVRSMAIQVAALVQAQDVRSVDRTLAAMQSGDPDIKAIVLRRTDGTVVAHAGSDDKEASANAADKPSADATTLGILTGNQRWGSLEVAFQPVRERLLADWAPAGSTKLLMLFAVAGTALFFLYLRRVLEHLDPSAAVPGRVRGAFDALTEGLVIVDVNERILLTNQSFEAMSTAPADAALLGKRVSGLRWLKPAHAGPTDDAAPWLTTLRTKKPVHGQPFQIVGADGAVTAKVVINCSPVLSDNGGVRGCLITVDDVTVLERSHEQLLEVLADLASSKQQLETKNAELENLANKDPLCGCLNRRALFVELRRLFTDTAPRSAALSCIMVDIDHFKSINDRFGHAVGDEAIQRCVDVLRNSVRPGDLVGRYGGEEFCVVLVGLSLEQTVQVAETMRQRVASERRVGAAEGHQVEMSASFGVTSITLLATSEAEFVDQADRAMYIAKQTGRNRVVAFRPPESRVRRLVRDDRSTVSDSRDKAGAEPAAAVEAEPAQRAATP
jgi:diguanylate cyclase (GGDEF)-like protein